MVVVADAAYQRILEHFGMKVIGIKSPSKPYWTDDVIDKTRIGLTLLLGRVTGSYENALTGEEAVEVMIAKLKEGYDLFICPAGVSNPSAPWRPGVGLIAIRLMNDPIGVGFVHIPNSFFERNSLKLGPTIGSLIPENRTGLYPRKVAALLHEEYQKLFL